MIGWIIFSTLALPLYGFACLGGTIMYFTITFGHVYVMRFKDHDLNFVLILLMMMSTHLFIQAEDKLESSTLAKWTFILISYANMFLSGFLCSLYEKMIARAFQRRQGYLVLSLFNMALFPLLWPVYDHSPGERASETLASCTAQVLVKTPRIVAIGARYTANTILPRNALFVVA